MIKNALLALSLIAFGPVCAADPEPFDLQSRLEIVRAAHDLVGLGAVVASSESGILAVAVSGERAARRSEPIELGDSWHIGSNTKMLTARLYAELVDRGYAEWGATLPDLFPDLAASIHSDWAEITIEDLLSHRSGLAANPGFVWFWNHVGTQKNLTDVRLELVQSTLAEAPKLTPGEFEYSNLGYIIAGAAIEVVASQHEDIEAVAFEGIFTEVLLGSEQSAAARGLGFGPPQSGIQGHKKAMFSEQMKPAGRGSSADNPLAFGPAGTAHHSLEGHALLLTDLFLSEDAGGVFDSKEKLLAPYPDETSNYALGLGVRRGDIHGTIYSHNGSNTFWLSTVAIMPERDLVIIVNTNQMNQAAQDAARQLSQELVIAYSGSGAP